MKKRIISGFVFVLLWILILIINNPIFDTAIVAFLAAVAMREYFNAFRNIGYKPISWIGYLGCFGILLMGGIIPEGRISKLLNSLGTTRSSTEYELSAK